MGLQNISKTPPRNIQIAITAFEDSYGKIPDRISCGNVTLHSSSLKSVITPGNRVQDSTISAFFGLIANRGTVMPDATFLILFRRAKHQITIKSKSEFFRHQYRNSGLVQLIFSLGYCQNSFIPLFNRDRTGNEKYCRLAALDKSCSIVRVYSPLRVALQYIKVLAESLGTKYSVSDTEWPTTWQISEEVYSSQQSNTDDCGTFTMQDSFFVSQGIMMISLICNERHAASYWFSLELSPLKSDISFLF